MTTQNKIKNPADQLVDDSKAEPLHPGRFIKNELLAPFGLNVSTAAARMGINRPNFHNVLEGRTALTNELAYRLEALTGVDADLLIDMQRAFDRAAEQERRAEIREQIERVQPLEGRLEHA